MAMNNIELWLYPTRQVEEYNNEMKKRFKVRDRKTGEPLNVLVQAPTPFQLKATQNALARKPLESGGVMDFQKNIPIETWDAWLDTTQKIYTDRGEKSLYFKYKREFEKKGRENLIELQKCEDLLRKIRNGIGIANYKNSPIGELIYKTITSGFDYSILFGARYDYNVLNKFADDFILLARNSKFDVEKVRDHPLMQSLEMGATLGMSCSCAATILRGCTKINYGDKKDVNNILDCISVNQLSYEQRQIMFHEAMDVRGIPTNRETCFKLLASISLTSHAPRRASKVGTSSSYYK